MGKGAPILAEIGLQKSREYTKTMTRRKPAPTKGERSVENATWRYGPINSIETALKNEKKR